MPYVVTNSPVYHVATTGDADGQALCGLPHAAHTASVVTQEPGEGFRICKRCAAKVTDGDG